MLTGADEAIVAHQRVAEALWRDAIKGKAAATRVRSCCRSIRRVDLGPGCADGAAMTERLFLDDMMMAEMTASVIASTQAGIVLDRTAFYARSGGQPGDAGTLSWDGGEVAITEAIKGLDDDILHVPAEAAALPPVGAIVAGRVDWARRSALMRMHTSLHLLCAVLPGVSVTGGQIGAAKSRLDFDMAEPPARDALEASLNALIAGDHPGQHGLGRRVAARHQSRVGAHPVGAAAARHRAAAAGADRRRHVPCGPAALRRHPCGPHLGDRAMRIVRIENKGRQNRRISLEFAS